MTIAHRTQHLIIEKVYTAASRISCGLFILSNLLACSSTLEIDQLRESGEVTSYKSVQLNVPFFPQEEYQCGPAALAMLLNFSAAEVSPEELVPLVYVPEKQGSYALEIVAATRYFERLPYVLEQSFSALLKELQLGNPVLVFQNLGLDWFPKWHFAVVTGVDMSNNQITLNSGTIKDHKMSLEQFERTWTRAKKWAMVAMRAGELPGTAEPVKIVKSASYFEQKQKFELAKSFYRAAAERWPDDLLVLMAFANVSYQTGQLDTAKTYYEKALAINQGYAPAHNNLALVFMKQGKTAEARYHAERAVSLGGKHAKDYQQSLSDIQQDSMAGEK